MSVIALAVADYAVSPASHKGIEIGPIFIPIGSSNQPSANNPGGASHSPRPGGGGGNPGPGQTPAGGGLPPVSGEKLPSLGLLMRGPTPPPASLQSVVHDYIIEAHWDTFQPAPGGAISAGAIYTAVAKVHAFNAANPGNPQSLRLRIEAGIHAPAWVKAMDGGPVAVSSPGGAKGTIPRYWYPDVQAAYASFVAKLAAIVDPIPEIREVTVGLTMLFFGEVFIRFPNQNAKALQAAGFTQTADLNAMRAMLRAHSVFRHTLTMLDVNAYQQLSGGGSLTITKQMMDYALTVVHGVEFTNASLTDSGNGTLYSLMQSYGPRGAGLAAISFQTMPTVGSISTVLGRAVSYGATSVELPGGVSASQVASYDTLLKQNSRPGPWPWH